MGAARYLRGAGGPAGAKVGGDGFGFRSLETQHIAALISHRLREFKYRDRPV